MHLNCFTFYLQIQNMSEAVKILFKWKYNNNIYPIHYDNLKMNQNLIVHWYLTWIVPPWFLCVPCRLKRSWFPFRRSAPSGSSTCWNAKSARSTASTWRACGWASATWAPWTFPRTTIDERSAATAAAVSWNPRASFRLRTTLLSFNLNSPDRCRWRRHSNTRSCIETAPESALVFWSFWHGQAESMAGLSATPPPPPPPPLPKKTYVNFLPLLASRDVIRWQKKMLDNFL